MKLNSKFELIHLENKKNNLLVVLKNGGLGLLFQSIPFMLLIFLIPEYIKYLGKEKWAITSLGFSTMLVLQFIDLGIPKSTNKLISQKEIYNSKIEAKKYIANGFFLIISISIIVGLIVYLLNGLLISLIFSSNNIEDFKKIIFESTMSCGLILININYFRNIFESNQSFYITSTLRAITLSIIYFPIIGFILFKIQIENLIKLLPLFYLIIFFVYLILAVIRFDFLKNTFFDKKIIKRLIKNGFFLFIIGLTLMLNNQLDRYFLNHFLNPSNSVYFLTCQDLFSKLNTISGSIALSLMPMVSYISSNNFREAKNLFINISKIILPFVLALFCLYLFFGDNFLEIWIDKSFSQKSFYISKYILAGYLINLFTILLFNTFIGLGRLKWILLVEFSIFIINPLLLYFFINSFSVNGAAFLLTVREIIRFSILFILFKKKIN